MTRGDGMDGLIEAIKLLRQADFIYIIGNGGAAGMADHLACDLLKGIGLKAISLCSNNSLITAIGNDYGFDEIFIEQLKTLFNPERDVLIAMSTSGNSKNAILAAEWVQKRNGKTIVLMGRNGGALRNYSTSLILIDAKDTQDCEDKIGIICHEFYKRLKE